MSDQSTVGVLDEFQSELVDAWRRVPNKALFFTLLAAWLALFQFLGNPILGYIHSPSLFSWMYEAYNSPNVVAENDRHGNLVPFLVVFLFWWKRKELVALPLTMWLPALGLLLVGMGLHVSGYVLQEPRFSVVALFTGIYALMGLAWGRECLQKSFFPFVLFVFTIPVGDNLQFITVRLQLLVCQLVEWISHFVLAIDVRRIGTQLFDPSGAYQYEVAAACSGIRSLMAILLLNTAYGFVTIRSWPKRLFLIAMALPFSVLGNVLRMLCIIVGAEMGGQKAGDWVHQGGPFGIVSLLPYVPAFFGVLWLGRYLSRTETASPAT